MTDEQRSSKELPAKEWRCFHCDEVFVTTVDARLHFGGHQDAESVCRIKQPGEFALLTALRNAEAELERYRREDSDVLRAMWSMQADHTEALRREEEKGFARGVADVKAHPESIGLRLADEPSARHPMVEVLAICDAYESGIGQGLKNRPMGAYQNPYDPVHSPHEHRAYGIGYDEGAKRSAQPPSAALTRWCNGCCSMLEQEFCPVHGKTMDVSMFMKKLHAQPPPDGWLTGAIRNLRSLRNHWNEFGPDHGFDGVVYQAEKWLEAYDAEGQSSTKEGSHGATK